MILTLTFIKKYEIIFIFDWAHSHPIKCWTIILGVFKILNHTKSGNTPFLIKCGIVRKITKYLKNSHIHHQKNKNINNHY